MKNEKLAKWVKNYDIGIIISAVALMMFALISWNLHKESNSLLELLAFPFSLLGLGLRTLSLTGSFGNILSWILFALLGSIPLLFSFILHKNEKKTSSIGLMFILGLFTYGLIYVNINPGILSAMQPSTAPASSGQVQIMLIILAMIFYYLVFSFLITLTLQSVETKEVISNLALLLLLVVGFTLISIFYLSFHELISSFRKSTEIDSFIYGAKPAGDIFISMLKFVGVLIPGIFFFKTGKAVLQLLTQLKQEIHTLENAVKAKEVGDYAKKTVMAYLISTLIFVFFQLIMSPVLTDVNVVLSLPLLELFISFFMLLLSRLFLESSALKKEIDQFI